MTITQGTDAGTTNEQAAGHVAAPVEPLITPYLRALVDLRGSDLHCKAGSPPRIRIDGRLRALQAPVLTPDVTERMLEQILRADLIEEFARTNEADFAYSLPGGAGRFRVNAFRQRGSVGLVLRRVAAQAVPLAGLGVPPVIEQLALEHRGLLLVTGPTGSGKTTTLAGMIDHINNVRESHIVTIEDPIEVLHTDNRSMISQREVRLDTADFGTALRAAMRQDPDVILVGEMRDQETVKAALSAAETGHFVMSTLHTIDAAETISRIIDFFPPHEQKQVRLALAGSLRGIVCQRLVPRADGAGRCVVMEICVNTGRIADAIADPDKTNLITDLIREGQYYQMQTFDQHLVTLVRDGVVTLEDAQMAASSPHDLAVELRRLGLVA
ncbi:type IV pilus twitching motility protein PilT [Kineococcus sp. GCM10028916]|uniref:type IV pilus twitching motility protein PilT n=1 Tax=Kineococcus sp. GCM10028916 TaxID=3273394 RepID=UPI003636C80F